MPITLEKIEKRKVTVGVIGMGYVGLPLSLDFCDGGAVVVAIDIDPTKVEQLNRGSSYLSGVSDERIASYRKAGKISASSDVSCVADCDAVIICVPTPVSAHLEPDLSYVVSTCESIASHITPGTLVCLESTTWPGTTEEVVQPLLPTCHVAFSPERVDPGNTDYTTRDIPKLVAGVGEVSGRLAAALYRIAVEEVVEVSTTRVAEASKLLENIFRGVNIALVNELKVIFHKMGIDVWEVIESAATKPFGFLPFWPGPGLGGHCIPIDPFYLSWKAKEFGITTRFIELAGEINRSMPEWVTSRVQDQLNEMGKPLKGARILILGLAYKADVGDLRESPSLKLIDLLQQKGASVEYNDPFFAQIPRTREYMNLMGKKSCPPSANFDLMLMATAHSTYQPEELLSIGVPIIDTRNFFPHHELVCKA